MCNIHDVSGPFSIKGDTECHRNINRHKSTPEGGKGKLVQLCNFAVKNKRKLFSKLHLVSIIEA